VLSYGSAFFVTRRTDATFVDGSLTVVDFDHPSEVATAAGIPLRVLNAVARTASEVLQLRINLGRREGEAEVARAEYEALRASEGATEIERLQALQRVLEIQSEIADLRKQIRDAQAAGAAGP
jgi:hypothetical protein